MILGLTLILCGFIGSFEYLVNKFPNLDNLRELVNRMKNIIAGISVFVGIWKFFGPDSYAGNIPAISFIGDLIPSLLAIIMGITVNPKILNLIAIPKDKKGKISKIFSSNHIVLGFLAMIFGFVHLLAGGSPIL